jgi:hypothetical protein
MIVGIIVLVGFIGCAIGSSILVSDMIEDINKVSPPEERENPLYGYPGKVGRIKRKHRRLYPDSSRAKNLNRLTFICAGLFLAGVVLLFGPSNFWHTAR